MRMRRLLNRSRSKNAKAMAPTAQPSLEVPPSFSMMPSMMYSVSFG